MKGLILFACGLLPQIEPVVTDVDATEINSFHNGDGMHAFTQIIWDRDGAIVSWRLLRSPGIIPIRRGEFYEAVWIDEGNVLRRVRTRTRNYTWNQDDRENLSRDKLPHDERVGLDGKP